MALQPGPDFPGSRIPDSNLRVIARAAVGNHALPICQEERRIANLFSFLQSCDSVTGSNIPYSEEPVCGKETLAVGRELNGPHMRPALFLSAEGAHLFASFQIEKMSPMVSAAPGE